eukprot:TRINITY_DN16268_c0_g1_i2.p1 TRINITY_DN16268_c0_g1~~TRINITY_DN16268_c0_g1_i2.p1  ORF type:complete len:397 (-),score=75.62 TRINITY_DN16268_c0_g1_i2:125-1315(-)
MNPVPVRGRKRRHHSRGRGHARVECSAGCGTVCKKGFGMFCNGSHHFCEECSTNFLRTTLLGDESIVQKALASTEPWSFDILCAICKAPCSRLGVEKVVHCGSEELIEAYNMFLAITTLDEGDRLEDCVLCSKRFPIPQNSNHPIMECINPDCKKMSCLVCKKEVKERDMYLHVGGGNDDDDKEDNCWKYMRSKSVVELACELAINGKCPDCGKSGRKDDNCTHINDCKGLKNGKQCSATWCYVCGLNKNDCDLGGSEGFIGHNANWQWNRRKCPLYLQEFSTVDNKFESDAGQAGDEFHRQRTLHYLQHVLTRIDAATVSGLLSRFPSCLQGYSLREIIGFELSKCLKRGRWWTPEAMDKALGIEKFPPATEVGTPILARFGGFEGLFSLSPARF